MLPQSAGIGRLVRWNANKKLTFVRTLSLDLSEEAAARIGQAQGLIGAELPVKVGDALVAHIEDAFENGIEEALRKLPASTGQEALFEAAVSKVNHALSRLLSDRGLVVPTENVNGVLLSQCGRSVVAAVWGEPSILLVRRKTPASVRIFDVLDSPAARGDRPRTGSRRGFTNLVSGALSSKDMMLVANRPVGDLIEMDALADILSGGRPETATRLLTEALTARHDDLALALLLLEGAGEQAASAPADPRAARLRPPAPRPAPTKTEGAVLEPRPGNAMRTVAQNASKASARALSVTAALAKRATFAVRDLVASRMRSQEDVVAVGPDTVDGPEPSAAADGQVRASDPSVVTVPGAEDAVHGSPTAEFKDAAVHAAHAIADLKTKEGRDRIRRLSRERTDRFAERLIEWYNGLPTRRKWLLLSALSLIFVLNVSVGIAGVQRFKERTVADYERQIVSIEQKIDSADASLIYRDEDRARRLLGEASAAVEALPSKKDSQAATRADLAARIETKLAELRHDVPLAPPEVETAIAAPDASKVTTLSMQGGSYWVTDGQGAIYSIEEGVPRRIDGADATDIFTPSRSGMLVGSPASGIAVISSAGDVTPMTLDTGGNEVQVNDATTFGSRLYILDAAHNRILRHPAVDGGYAAPQMYVRDATDLSDAVSFAIDGYVYVLSKDGRIARLLRGDNTDFAVSAVDPAVGSAVRLRTDGEDGDLYVLDASPARIIRFEKETGKLIAQYSSASLAGATDFVVDEAARRFLVLKDGQLLRFSWQE